MNLLRELDSNLLSYINGTKTLAALRQWFAPLSLDAQTLSDPAAKHIALAMIGEFSDFDEMFIDETKLKNTLSALLLPTAIEQMIVNQFGYDPMTTQSAPEKKEELTYAAA